MPDEALWDPKTMSAMVSLNELREIPGRAIFKPVNRLRWRPSMHIHLYDPRMFSEYVLHDSSFFGLSVFCVNGAFHDFVHKKLTVRDSFEKIAASLSTFPDHLDKSKPLLFGASTPGEGCFLGRCRRAMLHSSMFKALIHCLIGFPCVTPWRAAPWSATSWSLKTVWIRVIRARRSMAWLYGIPPWWLEAIVSISEIRISGSTSWLYGHSSIKKAPAPFANELVFAGHLQSSKN